MTAPDSVPLHALAEENLAAASPDLQFRWAQHFHQTVLQAADAACTPSTSPIGP